MVKIWQTNFLMIMTVYQTKVNKHITDKTSEIVKKTSNKTTWDKKESHWEKFAFDSPTKKSYIFI